MLKKKIIVVIISVFVLAFLGYAISSNIVKKNNNYDEEEKAVEVISENTEEEKEEKNSYENKFQNVVLTSKIGNKVLSKFCISNIYSKILYDKIDEIGLDDETKLMYTYITIVSNYDYHNMIKISDDSSYQYIDKIDFEKVYKELFGRKSVINHRSVITDNLYNEEKQEYEYLTFGYGGIEFNFILEIPYEIREYDDNIQVYFYRIYGTSSSELKKDGTQEQKVTLYENFKKDKEAYTGTELELQDNDSQKDYIKSLIDEGKIDKEKLEKVVYSLGKEDDEYYILSIKKEY